MLKKEEVQKVAKLARLKLSEKETDLFVVQLSNVLDLFTALDKVDVKNVEETSQVTGLSSVTQKDVVSCKDGLTCCTTEELLRNAPMVDGTGILVPKVIEDK